MEAELRSNLACAPAGFPAALRVRDDWRSVVFTVAQARRALPYVARIAREATEAFHAINECRQLLALASLRSREDVCTRRDRAIHRLGESIDECNAVGAHLLDFAAGSVGFQCEIEGRSACLIWQLDEPIDSAWVDLPGADR